MQKWMFALPDETPEQRSRQQELQKELEKLVDELSQRPGLGRNGVSFFGLKGELYGKERKEGR